MHKHFSVKIYIVWVVSGYTYGTDIYLGKNGVRVTTGYDSNLCNYYTVGKKGGGTWT